MRRLIAAVVAVVTWAPLARLLVSPVVPGVGVWVLAGLGLLAAGAIVQRGAAA